MQIERNKDELAGLTEITFSPEEALERLLPNLHKPDKGVWVQPLQPVRVMVQDMDEQDLARLEKEMKYRSGPYWDRLLEPEDLTVRAKNCLRAADIATFGDLVSNSKGSLLKYRIGVKVFHELEDLLERNGLDFIG